MTDTLINKDKSAIVMDSNICRRLSVAPMMEYTDKHCRYFLRTISKYTLLYTEMVTTGALIHGQRTDLLDFSAKEQPVALQLGGCCPESLAKSAILAQQMGYKEVNLNVGCPSNRVQEGGIGAYLMSKPSLVADCVKSMQKEVDIPISVKHRTGIKSKVLGDHTGYDKLKRFMETVAEGGCKSFSVHARVAILEGLSPKENRDIPPLEYDTVYQLKQDYPELEIILNGGVKTLKEVQQHLSYVDGVMIGRQAYHNPFLLSEADQTIFGDRNIPQQTREDIARAMVSYIEKQSKLGVYLHQITRHILGLYSGQPGARKFRRLLSEQGRNKNSTPEDYLQIIRLFTTE